MKKFVLCLLFGCLPAVTLSHFFSLTDPRYPERIVNDPRVICTENGSFPHPADCTWFYRCVDRMKTGFYQIFFFECEPGTVFLDPLDQCVYGSSESCSPTQAPPPSPSTPDILPPSPPPTTPEPSPSPTSTETPVPTDPPTETEPPVPTEAPVTATTVTPTPISVTIVCRNCVVQEICKTGREPYPVKVCDACRYSADTPYTTAKEECPFHPEPHLTSEGRCISGLSFCPAARQETPDLDRTYTIQCSNYRVRPDDPVIRQQLCTPYHYCTQFGYFLRTQTLCRNFFQCYKNQRNSWAVELRQCSGRNLYSFDLDQCVPEPKDTELCSSREGRPFSSAP